ncbi:putative class III homeodomain-leucine zipper family [Helianthus debilis subsp. tardiflorus]
MSACQTTRSVLTITFHFPFENSLAESVATMARQYVRSVINSVQRVAMAISPSGLSQCVGPKTSPGSPEALTLAQWICQSYMYHLGADLLSSGLVVGESLLKDLWQHQDAILCCSLKSQPVFIFANQSGLDMLETTLVELDAMLATGYFPRTQEFIKLDVPFAVTVDSTSSVTIRVNVDEVAAVIKDVSEGRCKWNDILQKYPAHTSASADE